MNRNGLLGMRGEDMAAGYLSDRGYAILCRNYRCREGEIDIVARKDGELVFIEVKSRSGQGMGWPEEAVDNRKQNHMRKAARHYIAETNAYGQRIRFDVVAIDLNHIENCM